jgi:hypothetical protein
VDFAVTDEERRAAVDEAVRRLVARHTRSEPGLLPVSWSTSNGSTSQGLNIYQRAKAEVPLTSTFLSHAALNSLGVA